jgi:hypothetical protein
MLQNGLSSSFVRQVGYENRILSQNNDRLGQNRKTTH